MSTETLRRLFGILVMFGTMTLVATARAADESEWQVLFDGSSLDAWKGYQAEDVPAGWVVDDGTLKHESGGRDLLTRETFGNFELRFDWKIAENGNSGVIYLCDEEEASNYMTGPEYQLIDGESWQLDPQHVQASGAIYGLYGASGNVVEPTGQWNSARIVVRDGKVEHWLNDEVIVSAEIGSPQWKSRIDGSKFANWERFGTLPEGHIALQAHQGRGGKMDPVWFRDIKIRSLD